MPIPVPKQLQPAFEVRTEEASLLAGIACGLAVTLPTIAAFRWQRPDWQWICIAALFVTIQGRNGPWQQRLLYGGLVLVLGVIALTLGTLAGGFRAAELITLPVVIGLSSYLWVWGNRAAMQGRLAAILFAVGLGLTPHSLAEVGSRTGWFTLGAVWGLAVTLVAWCLDRRPESRAPWTGISLQDWRSEARQEFGWHSVNFRHAVRAGILVTAAAFLARWLGMERHYWVTITVVSVLVPSRNDSWVRGIQVVLATLTAAGIVACAGSWVPSPSWLLVLVFLAALTAGSASGVNFGLYLVGALTAVLLQVELLSHDLQVWRVRIADAGLGVVLTLLAWGLYELSRLREFLRPKGPPATDRDGGPPV